MRTRIPIILAVWFCALAWAGYVISADLSAVVLADDPAALLKQADTYRTNKQYDQAEQLYLALAKGNSPEAFTAQKDLAFLYITMAPPQLDKAEAAYQQLLSRSAKNAGLSQAIYEIARKYEDMSQKDKAAELFEYNVAQFPDDAYAMRSQTRIVKFHISDANDGAAQAGFNKLLTMFSKQPTLPEEIHYVARKYEDLKRYDKAFELYQYNVGHFASNAYTVHSQVRIVWSYIRDANEAAANAAFDKLLALYPNEPTLPKEVFKVAKKSGDAGNTVRARQVYKYLIDTWSADTATIAQQHVAMAHICLGDEAAAQAAIEGLVANAGGNPDVIEAMLGIGETYYTQAVLDHKNHNYSQEDPHYLGALSMWERAMQMRPASAEFPPWPYLFAGNLHWRFGEWEKAIEYYTKLIELWPDCQYAPSAEIRLGMTYEDLKSKGILPKAEANEKARQAYKAVVERYPTSPLASAAHRRLGYLYLEDGQDALAIQHFQAFLTLAPPDDFTTRTVKSELERLRRAPK